MSRQHRKDQTMPARDHGPFDTEQQARELPEVRAVYAAFRADPGVGKMQPHEQRMLLDALAEAGVYLGAYDLRITEWLSTGSRRRSPWSRDGCSGLARPTSSTAPASGPGRGRRREQH